METQTCAPAIRGMLSARSRAASNKPALLYLLSALLVAAMLNAAAALPLFGADLPGDRRPIDDDVHAAASAAAARWHQKVDRIFGSGAGGDGRRLGRASALFGTAVPGISQLVLEDAAEAASGGITPKERQATKLPCVRDDGTVGGSTAAGCQPAGKQPKSALLAHHMYQQRDDEEPAAGSEPVDGVQQHQLLQKKPQHADGGGQGRHAGSITGQQLHRQQPKAGRGAHSSTKAAGARLAGGQAQLAAAVEAAAEMQPLAVHSRIVDRALDDHLERLGHGASGNAIGVIPLPVDGPGSTLRGWEAADEGGALGLGFQNIVVDAAGQAQEPGRQWRIIGVTLQLFAAAACAAVVTGFVARYRDALAQREAARYGDTKRLPLLSTPQPTAAADSVAQPLTPESAGCRPRRLEADLDLASPLPASPAGSPCFDLAACRVPAGDKPRSGRTIHLHAFAGGLTIAPPQPPFSPPAGSSTTYSAACSGPSPLALGSPLSLASPTPSPAAGNGKKHVRWELPSPEWTALSPGAHPGAHFES